MRAFAESPQFKDNRQSLLGERPKMCWADSSETHQQSQLEKLRGFELKYLNRINSDPNQLRQQLKEYKVGLERSERKSVSRATLCAKMLVNGTCPELKDQALNLWETGQRIGFMAWMDFASGIENLAEAVILAELQIAGKAEHLIRSYITKAENYDAHMREAKITAGLLTKDPSGYNIVDRVVDRITRETQGNITPGNIRLIAGFQSPMLFQGGTEFAAEGYKAIYPLTR